MITIRNNLGGAKSEAASHPAPAPAAAPSPMEPAVDNLRIDFPVHEIQRRVAAAFGVMLSDMMSERKSKEIVQARFVAMWLARSMTVYSLPTIGRLFNRDHTSVINAVRRVREILADGGPLAEKIRRLHVELAAEFDVEKPSLGAAVAVVSETIAARITRELLRAVRTNPKGLLEALSKLAFAGIAAGLAFAQPAAAGEPRTRELLCFIGREDVVREYRRAGQLRIFEGVSRSGRIVDVLRARDGVFTIFLTGPDDVACMIDRGANSNIFPPSSPGPLPHPVPEKSREKES